MGKERESQVDYWLTEDGLLLIRAWARDGNTLEQIATKMGVTRYALSNWRRRYPEIKEAIQTSKEIVDYKVENALLKAALGFTTKEIKVTLGKKIVNGEVFEVLKETTTKEVAPNVTACLAWLNNRKHDQWKRNRDKVLELDEEDNNVTISIVRGPKQDDLGNNVNQEVNFTPGKKEEIVEDSSKVSDKDAWPEDWDEEDE